MPNCAILCIINVKFCKEYNKKTTQKIFFFSGCLIKNENNKNRISTEKTLQLI